jgi:hypothetical protein
MWGSRSIDPLFLTWALDGVEWTSTPLPLNHRGEKNPGTHWIRGRMCSRFDLDAVHCGAWRHTVTLSGIPTVQPTYRVSLLKNTILIHGSHYMDVLNHEKFACWQWRGHKFPGKYVKVFQTLITFEWSPLWSSGQSSRLQIQRSRVRFPALPDFLRSNLSGTGSTQPLEDKWGAIWVEK